VRLADPIDWDGLNASMNASFVPHKGRPATSPRLVAGLLYLEHAFDLSDEEVVWQWVENPYWQEYRRMKKALRTLSSRVGRVMHDVERKLDSVGDAGRGALTKLVGRIRRIPLQKQKDKNKLYALHAPEVECVAEGKARTPYEFGVKVSITTTHKEGLVIVARSMPGNPYDGHTLAEAMSRRQS
jgi:hypothetical protein